MNNVIVLQPSYPSRLLKPGHQSLNSRTLAKKYYIACGEKYVEFKVECDSLLSSYAAILTTRSVLEEWMKAIEVASKLSQVFPVRGLFTLPFLYKHLLTMLCELESLD
jgi:hypothetical protein